MQTTANSTTDQKIRAALKYLFSVCDGATTRDGQGFNGGDARNPFLISMSEKTEYTPNMIRSLMPKLIYYKKQLASAGYELPSPAEIAVAIKEKKSAPQEVKIVKPQSFIDMNVDFIFVVCPYAEGQKLKAKFIQCRDENPAKYCGALPHYFNPKWDGSRREWTYPMAPRTAQLIRHILPDASLSATAKDYYEELEKRLAQEAQQRQDALNAKDKRYNDLLAMIGGLDAEFAPGKTLYPHQKECVDILLKRPRFIIGDKPGLGKTYECILAVKAYIKLRESQGLTTYCYIITPKSARGMWYEVAAEVGVKVDVYTWEKQPIATNEYPSVEFIAIYDEAHRGKNIESQRTRAMLSLAWHPNCIGTYLLTGTPYKNACPLDFMTLMMAIRHPLVYEEFIPNYPINFKPKGKKITEGCVLPSTINKKMYKYKVNFCEGHDEWYGAKKVFEAKGCSNEKELNRLTQYDPKRTENHPNACLISRMKSECPGMPKVTRIRRPATLSYEEVREYAKTLAALWKKVEENVPLNLAKWIEKQTKEENDTPEGVAPTKEAIKKHEVLVKNAEALVQLSVLKRAAAVAKVNQSFEEAASFIEAGEKVVIFTQFKDSLELLGKRIEEELGVKVGYIHGDVSEKLRNEYVKDFQSAEGSLRVIISTSAGGEAITLTAATCLIIVDRPWTTAEVEQQEGRVDRRGAAENVTIIWPQMPENVSLVDVRVDGGLLAKQKRIDALQFGGKDSHALDFDVDIIQKMQDNSYNTVREAVLMAQDAVSLYKKEA